MHVVLAFLVLTVLTGCADARFKKELSILEERKRTAISEIQRQQALRQMMVTDSHTQWLRSLTPEQLADYRIAESTRQTSQMKQNKRVLEGLGGLIEKMIRD